jgi:hypothetical protein
LVSIDHALEYLSMQPIKILIATLGLAATAAFAQPPGGPDGHGGRGGPPGANLERLTVLLDLDAYQKTQVERVLKEQRETMQAQRNAHEATGERPSFSEMQSLREQARADTITKLQSVLTELQITKFKLLTEPPAGRPGGRRGPPRAADESVNDGQ